MIEIRLLHTLDEVTTWEKAVAACRAARHLYSAEVLGTLGCGCAPSRSAPLQCRPARYAWLWLRAEPLGAVTMPGGTVRLRRRAKSTIDIISYDIVVLIFFMCYFTCSA